MLHSAPRPASTPASCPARSGSRIVLLAFLGLVSACSGASEVAVEELVRDGHLFLDPATMEPYSGLAFATYESRAGVLAQKMRLGTGSYAGPFDAIFDDRRLSSKEVYENGVRHGPYQWFFESGRLFEEGTYVEGRLDGPYRAYWETGELYEEGTYRRGQFDGPRRWYMKGRLVEVVTYRMGVIEGLYERYSADGELDLKGNLYEGEPCGMWIEGDRPVVYTPCGPRLSE